MLLEFRQVLAALRAVAILTTCLIVFPVNGEDSKEQDTPSPNLVDNSEGESDANPDEDSPSVQRRAESYPSFDGFAVRLLGFYQRQMDEVVPKNFLPISMDRFEQGVKRILRNDDDDHRFRLSHSDYWIDIRDGLLMSQRSELHIESIDARLAEQRGPVGKSAMLTYKRLGPVNIAIEPLGDELLPTPMGGMNLLTSDADGNLIAVLADPDSAITSIPFQWQRRGIRFGAGHRFDLQIPRSPQTRIVLSAPRNIEVRSLDGVLHLRTGPPPDADQSIADDRSRWYELDAGGLSQIRLQTMPRKSTNDDPWMIRGTSIQYEVDATGLNWICRMTLKPSRDGRLPLLELRNSTVTKVTVNAFEVPFEVQPRGARRSIRIEPPDGVVLDQPQLTTIVMQGTSTYRSNSNWCELPMPRWLGNVRDSATLTQARLLVDDEVQIANWELPKDWSISQRAKIDDEKMNGGGTVLSASGPPPFQSSPTSSSQVVETLSSNFAWSRLRLARKPHFSSSTTVIRLDWNSETLRSQARMDIKSTPDQIIPLRIRVQPDWNVDSVVFRHSKRVIEEPRIAKNGQIMTLWPDSNDIDGDSISLDIFGSRSAKITDGRLTIPATWFTAPKDIPNRLIAAIVRPTELKWISDALTATGRTELSQLDPAATAFLGQLPQETLLFQPILRCTPRVALEQPVASFSAETDFYLKRDGGDMIEQLEIRMESSGQRLQQLTIRLGSDTNISDYEWSIGNQENSSYVRLPSSAISISSAENHRLCTIGLNDQNFHGRRIIGQRAYPASENQAVVLPSVVGATSSSAIAWIGPGWKVVDQPHEVYSVLADPSHQFASTLKIQRPVELERDISDMVALRYEQAQSPEIKLTKSEPRRSITVVQHEQVKVIASSRGVDRIEAIYAIAPSTEPLQFQAEPNMRLVGMVRNGESMEIDTDSEQQVTVPASSISQILKLSWNRDQYENRWLRHCKTPEIKVSGIVLRSEYQLTPAADAFAPVVLLRGFPRENALYTGIRLQPDDSILLLRRNIALAAGWLLAILVFALSWQVSRNHPLVVAGACLIVATAILLWWPWKLAIIGYLMVPMVSAGLLATSQRLERHRHDRTATEATKSVTNGKHSSSGDFSVPTIVRIFPWSIMIGMLAGGALMAQETESSIIRSTESGATQSTPAIADGAKINVLVPMDPQGNQVGETIYISQHIYQQIVDPDNSTPPAQALIQSAHYQINIDRSKIVNGQVSQHTVKADFVIRTTGTDRKVNPVRLPLDASTLRRLELIGKQYRYLRFEPDTPNSVIAYLPSGKIYRLRASFNAEISRSNHWRKLSLPIPRVHAARVTVESDENYEFLRIGQGSQEIIRPSEPRRWNHMLGPIDRLVVEYPIERAASNEAIAAWKRLYVVDVGQRIVSVDCQIDPGTELSAGDSVEFTVTGDQPPKVTTDRWILDRSERTGATSRRITLRSLRDLPGPIRLNWSNPVISANGSIARSFPISIPDVASTDPSRLDDTWIALRCDPELQFAPLVSDDLEPLSVDHFYAAWQGHDVEIERAYVGVGAVPQPIVQSKIRTRAKVDQQHHLHVTADRLLSDYRATLDLDRTRHSMYRLRLPIDVRLQELLIAGIPQPIEPIRYDGYAEIPLDIQTNGERVEIHAIGFSMLDGADQFKRPAFGITPTMVALDRLWISRDPSIALHAPEQSSGEESWNLDALPTSTAIEWLTEGWSPVGSWLTSRQEDVVESQVGIESPSSNFRPPTKFEVNRFASEPACRQLVTVQRQDAEWMATTEIVFDTVRCPDIVDVEIPSRWCDALEVEGALQWMPINIEDSQRQIIRIRFDRKTVVHRPLKIRSRLEVADTSQPAAPDIRVLGTGHRIVYVQVPQHADSGETFQWQTSGVESVDLPAIWSEQQSTESPSSSSCFLVRNPIWSIALATSVQALNDPVAFLMDANTFTGRDGIMVHTTWELAPGDLDTVDVRLPNGANLLAAWSAGRNVEIDTADLTSDDNLTPLQIPLSISRLPQSVEVLFKVSFDGLRRGDYLPELVGIPATRRWLVHHVPKNQINSASGPPQLAAAAIDFSRSTFASNKVLADRRLFDLADAIVDAVNTVDRLTKQPSSHSATLLKAWQSRFRSVQQSVPDNFVSQDFQSRWDQLDSAIAPVFRRHGLDTLSEPNHNTPNTDRVHSPINTYFVDLKQNGFEVDQIVDLEDLETLPALDYASYEDRALRTLIFNLLSLGLIAGLLICLVPVHHYVQPIVRHPASWLALVGIISLAVAPIAVAGALILLAITLPVFPRKT